MIKRMTVLLSALAVLVGAPVTSHAAPPFQASNEPYSGHECGAHDGNDIVIRLQPASGPPCTSSASADAEGNGAADIYVNSNYGRYGYGWGTARSRLTFDIPRPVAELPIEAHLMINRASAKTTGGPEGSSDVYVGVSLWLRQDPRCGCDRDYLLAEKSVLLVGRGSAQTITDQAIVLSASLWGYEELPAGTYGVEVRTDAQAHTGYPGHEAWASFDVTLLKMSVAGHRSFVGRRAR